MLVDVVLAVIHLVAVGGVVALLLVLSVNGTAPICFKSGCLSVSKLHVQLVRETTV